MVVEVEALVFALKTDPNIAYVVHKLANIKITQYRHYCMICVYPKCVEIWNKFLANISTIASPENRILIVLENLADKFSS